ncbi:hypothetical protein ACFXTN_026695 [Malus domestica]
MNQHMSSNHFTGSSIAPSQISGFGAAAVHFSAPCCCRGSVFRSCQPKWAQPSQSQNPKSLITCIKISTLISDAIDRVKISDARPNIIHAFAGTNIAATITVENGDVLALAKLSAAHPLNSVVTAPAKTTYPDRATSVNGRLGLFQTTAPMKLLHAGFLCMTEVAQSQPLTVASSTAKPSQNITVDHHPKNDDKKIRGTVLLMKNNVLELNSVLA